MLDRCLRQACKTGVIHISQIGKPRWVHWGPTQLQSWWLKPLLLAYYDQPSLSKPGQTPRPVDFTFLIFSSSVPSFSFPHLVDLARVLNASCLDHYTSLPHLSYMWPLLLPSVWKITLLCDLCKVQIWSHHSFSSFKTPLTLYCLQDKAEDEYSKQVLCNVKPPFLALNLLSCCPQAPSSWAAVPSLWSLARTAYLSRYSSCWGHLLPGDFPNPLWVLRTDLFFFVLLSSTLWLSWKLYHFSMWFV